MRSQDLKTDPHSSPEVIARVKKYIPDVESYVYEAGHAFANDARPDFYVEQAALDARSLSVTVRSSDGTISSAAKREIESAILSRARQLRLKELDL